MISMVFRGKVDASVSAYRHAMRSRSKLPGWENGGMVSWVKSVFFRGGRGKYNIRMLETLGLVEMTS